MWKCLLLAQVWLISTVHGFDIFSDFEGLSEQQEHFDDPCPTPRYFVRQKVNHFDSSKYGHWKQRYIVLDEHYKPGGPVFLITQKGDIHICAQTYKKIWTDYAKQFGGMCVIVEHRYYGLSLPFPDASTKNLKYLANAQVLRDYVQIVEHLVSGGKVSSDSKWITIGGSYGGNLAAWMRMKFPHLIHGAIVSNAPLHPALQSPGLFEIAKDGLNNHSQECSGAMKSAFSQLNILLSTSRGQEVVKQLFTIELSRVDPLFGKLDVPVFNYILAFFIAARVVHGSNDNVEHVCNVMTNSTIGTHAQRIAVLFDNRFPAYSHQFHEYEKLLQEEAGYIISPLRIQLYQSCYEHGLFPTPDTSAIFGKAFSVKFYRAVCQRVFDPHYNLVSLLDAQLTTEIEYNGAKMNATNVVFVHGSKDPYRSLSVVNSPNEKSPVISIEGFADHVLDLRFDSAELNRGRAEIAALIKGWLEK